MNNCLLTPKTKKLLCPQAPKKQLKFTRIDDQSIRSICRMLFNDQPNPEITITQTV
ncbi:unnamed protein product [Paramecium octaurelia]|uniref:Uncharacterized protein n=1 Tax=Paramecium octaurelia TaxID=43137 RepID=A0A8S1UJ75_PAROT|nr:unnamed protein product [Paramecium octaurelia]